MVYTRGARFRLIAVLTVALVMLVLGGILGYLGGHKTFQGGGNLLDAAYDAVTEMSTLNSMVAKKSMLSLGSFCGGSWCIR